MNEIIQLVQTGQWIALAFLVLTLVNTWLSPNSKFPITIPEWLRALLTILVGQVLGVLAAFLSGQPWKPVAFQAVVAGLLSIAASHAVWNGKATPVWMQIIAGVLGSLDNATLAARRAQMDAIIRAKGFAQEKEEENYK